MLVLSSISLYMHKFVQNYKDDQNLRKMTNKLRMEMKLKLKSKTNLSINIIRAWNKCIQLAMDLQISVPKLTVVVSRCFLKLNTIFI